jgi:phosphoheptose isomerase
MSDLLGKDRNRLAALGVDVDAVLRAALALAASLRAGHKVLTFGNGGSAADAQHFAAELTGRFELERPGLPAVALTTDTSALTAIANDYGFAAVFARQIEALGRPGDVALGISTSGTSPNVVAAIEAARRRGMTTISLCGSPGCRLCEVADVPLVAVAESTASVQEIHLTIEHALCRAVEQALFAGALPPVLPPGHVLTLDELIALRQEWRAAGRSVVWTNGCFDVLHSGHLASLAGARALGDILVVGINDDGSVRRLKGPGRPIVPATDRAAVLAALRTVDYVIVFGQDTPEEVLERVRPDIACKGSDYAGASGKPVPERAVVEAHGGRMEFLPWIDGRSTTQLLATAADDPL